MSASPFAGYLTLRDVAKRAGISPRTVEEHVRLRWLRPVSQGLVRAHLFSQEEFGRWYGAYAPFRQGRRKRRRLL